MRRLITVVSLAAAAAVLAATPPVASAMPDREDAVQVFSRDVLWLAGASLVNPDMETPTSATLYNVAGLDLGLTWGDWLRASATSRVNQVGGTNAPRSDVRISLDGLVPSGVYSIFYGTIGPDSENPKCPGVERLLPLDARRPDATAPDESSFVADADGAAEFRGSVEGRLLDATQLFFAVIYHSDGMTYGDLPNRGEFVTQGDACRSSFGHDAMRQLLILQKW